MFDKKRLDDVSKLSIILNGLYRCVTRDHHVNLLDSFMGESKNVLRLVRLRVKGGPYLEGTSLPT